MFGELWLPTVGPIQVSLQCARGKGGVSLHKLYSECQTEMSCEEHQFPQQTSSVSVRDSQYSSTGYFGSLGYQEFKVLLQVCPFRNGKLAPLFDAQLGDLPSPLVAPPQTMLEKFCFRANFSYISKSRASI